MLIDIIADISSDKNLHWINETHILYPQTVNV